jgi:hypothetical protein
MRTFGTLCAVLALLAFVGNGAAADKPQMVKGTVKSVDVSKKVLIVNQKVKNEVVDRELSILDTTEWIIMIGNEKKEAVGAVGLQLIEGKEGSTITVKCDKDVNVLKVTVKVKK